MNAVEFKNHGKALIDFLSDYIENIETRNVLPSVEPGFLSEFVPNECSEEPEPFEDIIKDFESHFLDGITHEHHPHYNAYFSSGLSYPGTLGELACAGLSVAVFNWINCPAGTELENIVLDWYAKAMGLPEAFISTSSIGGGVLQNSASECILISMIAARSKAIKDLKGSSKVHESSFVHNLIAYGSKHANCALEKAAKLALTQIRMIDVDDKGQIRVDLLREAILNDIKSGLTPYFVMATLGTTGTTAFDDVYEIGKLCETIPSIWFHIDGAYGLNAFILPELRRYGKGMEMADSVNVNACKMLLVNFDSSAMWVKNLKHLDSALGIKPVYLTHEHENANGVLDYRNYGISLGRRLRALKLWFVFRNYGLKGLRMHVRNIFSLAKKFESIVRTDNRFEVVNEVNLGLVNFRLRYLSYSFYIK